MHLQRHTLCDIYICIDNGHNNVRHVILCVCVYVHTCVCVHAQT